MKRTLIISSLVFFSFSDCISQKLTDQKPHVLFIAIDDMRYIETRSDITDEPLATELYNLRKDSIEIKNDLDNYLEVVKKHAALLDEYLKTAKKWTDGNMISSCGRVE